MTIGHRGRCWSVEPGSRPLSASARVRSRGAAARLPRRRLVLATASLIAGGTWLLRAPARAQSAPLTERDRAAFRMIISNQIDAFRADDGERAFGFASPGIRQMFGTAEAFMAMVRSGYRPVYRPQRFSFGDVEAFGELYVQHVRLVGPEGARVKALYLMERQTDGAWLIAGCHLVDEDDGSV